MSLYHLNRPGHLAAIVTTTLCLLLGNASVSAAPALLDEYSSEARQSRADFQADTGRGQQLFTRTHSHSPELPSCSHCHGSDPRQPGKHALTGKRIEPMAVSANPARFSDRRKADKWFGRNCREVLGRECTDAEKADVVRYLAQGAN